MWLLVKARQANRPGLLLAGAVVAFVVALTALSQLRLLELTTSTWDLGIYQQALWSASHGRPFFEAADMETGGFGSFLQVHSAFILYAIVPVYSALPSPATLFAIQAAVVGCAAFPLFALTRSLGGSPRRALLVAGLYLTSAFTISSTLYDFHVEAFLPLEVFALVYFWSRRQYLLGSATAALTFVTMEAGPAFAFACALFFLVGALTSREANGGASGPTRFLQSVVRRLRRPEAVAAIGLAIVSIVAYYLLLGARMRYLAEFAGFPPFPAGEHGYLIGGTPGSLGLSLASLSVGFHAKATYWLTAFALVGFLPLRTPRSLLLAFPWIVFTFASAALNLVMMGFQYGFLVVAGLFPGVAYTLATWKPDRAVERPETATRKPRRRRAFRLAAGLVVAGLLAANLALTPIDPLTQGPGPGSAYQLSYTVAPGFSDVARIAGIVPSGAPVLASDLVFPLVANDVHAFSLFWGPNPYLQLPFNSSSPPAFVFLAESRLDAVPGWLDLELYDSSIYGIRAVAWTSPVGAVVLFEHGYIGVPETLGPIPSTSLVIGPSGADAGTESWIVDAPGTPFGQALESVPYGSGQLWATPGFDLPPGRYEFTFWVKAWATDSQHPPTPTASVLVLEGDAFAQGAWFSTSYSFAGTATAAFEPFVLFANLSQPALHVVLRGYALTWMAGIGLSEITVSRL